MLRIALQINLRPMVDGGPEWHTEVRVDGPNMEITLLLPACIPMVRELVV